MPRVDVSVVIPAWRAQDTIGAAIRSALDQTGVTVEVIVVDDCCPNNSAAAAAAVGDARVRVYRQDENGGPARARNRGFAEATGRWIAVLDSDDLYEPGRLGRMVALGDGAKADIVLDNLLVVTDGAPPRPMFPPVQFMRLSPLRLAEYVRRNHPFSPGEALGYAKPLFRRAFLAERKLAYDPSLRVGEDYLLVAEMLAAGARGVIDPNAGYRYTRRAGSISFRLQAEHVHAMRRADEAFVRRYALDADTRRALRDRRAALDRALAFVTAVDELKGRRIAGAAQVLSRRPSALWHFRLPIRARIARLMN